MSALALFNIGPFELLVLGGAAVLLFGGDLPDAARKAARMVGKMRAMTDDLRRELRKSGRVDDLIDQTDLREEVDAIKDIEVGLDPDLKRLPEVPRAPAPDAEDPAPGGDRADRPETPDDDSPSGQPA